MSSTDGPGCIVILLDESVGMRVNAGEIVAGGKPSTKSNAERVATCINALLAQLGNCPDFEIAIVGYKTENGHANVGCRWGGSLAGRDFVAVKELAVAPTRSETRQRSIPLPDGSIRRENVSVPLWYEPSIGENAPQLAAHQFCLELISRWLANAGPRPGQPLLIHIFSGASSDGNPDGAVTKLMQLGSQGSRLLLLQAQVAAGASLVTTLYPSSLAYLAPGPSRDLFRRTSILPDHLVSALNASKSPVNANARGMLLNAKIPDLVRLLSLVKTHVNSWPKSSTAKNVDLTAADKNAISTGRDDSIEIEPSASEVEMIATPSVEPGTTFAGEQNAGLILFVLDRSTADPANDRADNSCRRLQTHANNLLKQVAAIKDVNIDVAILSYGRDDKGNADVCTTFSGPLSGRTIVSHLELLAGALRVEETEEQMSNGIGGLVTVNRKNPIFYDVEPTEVTPPVNAFEAAAGIIKDWHGVHPTASFPSIILHLTRGEVDAASIDQAVERVIKDATSKTNALLYHLIATEAPHRSVAYAATDAGIDAKSLKHLWQLTSPLLDWQRIATERATIQPNARGFVINGKFDLLLAAHKQSLSTAQNPS